jgi:RHS repeat-associated protein
MDYGNHPPAWITTPVVSAYVNTDYIYPSKAIDPDGDRLNYSLIQSAAGMTMDPISGELRWRPTDDQLGLHEVIVRTTDDARPNLYAEQQFVILVGKQPGNSNPVIVSTPSSIYNVVTPNPAVGPVSPISPIVINVGDGEVSSHQVMYTRLPTLPQADVLFLLDDTASMDRWGSSTRPGSESLLTAFMQSIDGLVKAYPETDFAFGVSRLENFALSDPQSALNRPFILNQPIYRSSDAGFERFITQALMRRAPGVGAGTVSIFEALYQASTGLGLDYGSDSKDGTVGPVNGSNLDNHHSLDIPGQTLLSSNGDVAAFNTPREFRYRILKLSDFPKLPSFNLNAPIILSGKFDEPRIAQGWRFQSQASHQKLRLSAATEQGSAEWLAFNPTGERIYQGPSNVPIEIKLATPGEYTLVLNSLSNSPLNYNSTLSLHSHTQPLPLDRNQSGKIQYQQQSDHYTFSLPESTTIMVDVMNRAPGVQWTLRAPDGVIKASNRFSDAVEGTDAANDSGDTLLKLAPGDYQLEINATLAAAWPHEAIDYAIALRTLPAIAHPPLAPNGSLSIPHATDRPSSTSFYGFSTTTAGQVISLEIPERSVLPNVRQWIVDADGNVLHKYSNYSNSSNGIRPTQFLIASAGDYTVLFDGDINREAGNLSTTIRLNCNSVEVPPTSISVSPNQIIDGTVTSPSGVNYKISVPSNVGDLYFDPLSLSPTLGWTLLAPSGAIVARSKWNGDELITDDALPKLSNKPLHLDRNGYSLLINKLADSPAGRGTPFQFRLIDLNNIPIVDAGTITQSTTNEVGTKLVRVSTDGINSRYFKAESLGTTPWKRYAPDHALRFEVDGTADGGYQSLRWPGSNPSYSLLDLGRPSAAIGTALATIYPHLVHHFEWSSEQLSEGTYWSSEHEHIAVENEYHFSLSNPSHFYFEPRPNSRNADADWSILGSHGTIVAPKAFSASAADTDPQESNSVWLREGEYRLVVRSRSGDVGFRFVDLPNAGAQLTSTLINGDAGPNPEGARFFAFYGRQGDWNRIRFTEPNTRGSSGILRVRVLDPFGRLVTTRFVPGPINSVPSPGYVDIDLDLPTTGRYSVIVEQPRSGNLTRSFTIQRDLKSNFPASDVRSLITSTPHAVSIESTKLLYDATFQSVSSERYFFDGLSATGDYPTDIIFNQRGGGRHFSNSMSSSDIIHLNTTNPLLVQTYTNSVPITSSGTRGGAGFRPHSVPIIVLATDTWSDVRAAGQRKNTQPTEVIGYGESVVPQDHLSGAFLNPNPNPGEAFSFLFPDPNSSSGRIQYRDLNIGNPPNARILEDNIVRSTEATITKAIDALQDLGAYVLPVFMDYTSSFDSPEQRQIHESWYDLPQAIARLTGATNASDNDLNTGDSDFSIEPNQPLTFFFDGYRSSQQATQLTSAVSQFLQSGRLDVDIVASDPSIQIQTSGAVENLKPGQTAKFDIQFTGDGTNRTFDLLFVRKGTGNIVGSIPVQIQQPYRYPARAVDPDDDPLTFSMVGQSHGASIDPRSGQLVWTPPAPGTYPLEITVSDGRGGRDQQSWSVTAGPDLSIASNRSPNVETIPNQTAYVGNDFTYQVIATDEDRDPILYFLQPSSARSNIPDGLSIDRKTGEIHWNAKTATRTWTTVLVGARDSKGGISTTPLKIQAILPPSEPNSPPVIDPIPDLHILAGNSIDWRMRGSDPQSESIVFRLSLGNERGAIIDPITDMFHWEPTEEHLGIHEMIVAASDPHGAVSTRKFKIIVDAPNRVPVFRERVIPGPTNSNRHYTFTPSAFDPDGDSITFAGSPTNPTGVAIDAVTGQLDWTPTNRQTGSFSIAILASDEHGGTAILEWKLEVLTDPPPNRLPVFISEPRTVIRSGFEWSYDIEAIDMDGDPVSYAVDLPDEFQFDSGRRIVWPNPREGFDPRDLWIGIQAYDGFGTSEQWFQLSVSNSEVNQAPNFTSFPEGLVATAGKRWRYNANAVDPEKDPVSFSFAQGAPQGMSIDPLTGIVSWLPNLDQVGEATIAIQVTDIYGASNVQQFTITVAASDLPPTIDSTPGIKAKHSTEYRYNILAHDPEDQPLRYRVLQGPATATISSQGVLVWPVPKTIDEGVLFEIAVDTGPGTGSTRQRWFVTPSAEGEDLPPEFISIPTLVIGVGEPYNYRAVATDRDSDPNRLRYSLVTIPRVEGIAGAQPMTIDPITGQVTWTPVAGHLNPGNEWIEIVADSDGKQSHQRFRVRVKPTNHEPVTQPLEMPQVVVGQIAMLDVRTDDADGDPIRYRTIDAPHGLFIDVHGRIRWATSTLTQPGKYAFHVLATDDRGAEEQPIPAWIDVVADTQSPIVSIQADRSPTRTTWVTTFYVDAADVSGIASRSLSYRRLVNGQPDGDERPITVNASGFGQHRFDQAGIYRLTARARDTFGNEGTSQLDLAVGDGSAAPKVLFESPTPYASISEPTAIVGSIQDSDLVSWILVVTTRDGEVLRTIATGTNPIPSGSTLGWIDTTLLPTGSLQLVLKGTDLSGQSEEAVLPIQVTGMLKLGNARMTFTDATIPVAGIPITVRRTYDSLNAATIGDFGYGWKLEFQQMALDIRADTLGDDGTTRYPPFIDGSRVLVTLPDGTQEGFTFEPRVRARVPISGDPLTWTPYFKPDSGNTSALGVPQNELNRQGGGKAYRVGSMANNDSYSPVDPAIAGYFVLQTADGMRHFIDAATGDTTRIADKNGNEVRFTEEGLVSNRGRSLNFERNHRGLITKITDPRGNSLSYEYDSSDRLVSFQDRNQYAARVAGEKDARTRFEYRDEPAYRNYLNTVTDANGTITATLLYDPVSGRLEGVRDAMGNIGRQTYTIQPPSLDRATGLYAVHTYAPGQSPNDPSAEYATIELNNLGLALVARQPNGEQETFVYDSPLPTPTESRVVVGLDDRTSGESNDLVTKTSFLWSNTYSYAFVSRTIDPRGNVTELTYDKSGQLIAETDANGNTTQYLYDRKAELDNQFALPVRGNVKYISSPDGNSTRIDYDPNTGQTVRIRNQQNRSESYSETRLQYDAHGDVTRVIDDQGKDQFVRNDFNGNGKGTLYVWSDPNGLLPNAILTTTNIFDANDKAIKTVSQIDGIQQNSITTQYDATGRPWQTIDSNGLKTENFYDKRGLLIQSRTETTSTDLNPLTNQWERLWTLSRNIYDEQGRLVIASTGLMQFESDATQLITTADETIASRKIFNTKGQLIATEQLRHLEIEVVPDGPAGIYLSRIKEGSSPTVVSASRTIYDAQNRVSQCVDSFGKVSQSYYDRYGNVVESRSQTVDENGESLWLVTRTVYDAKGRVAATTDPYLVPATTPLGKQGGNSQAVLATFNLYDTRGRSEGYERRSNVITGWTSDSEIILSAVVSTGDFISQTRTQYDAQGRPYKQISADGQESITLYDEKGRTAGTLGSSVDPASIGLTGPNLENKRVRLRSETEYNSLGQAYKTKTGILQIENQDGSISSIDRSQQRVTEQLFNAKGQIITTVHPDGTLTHQEYDSFGRVVAEIDPLGHRKSLEYNTQGQLVQVQLPAVPNPLDENKPTRPSFQYEYNAFGQMTKLTDANGHITSFGFNGLNQSISRILPAGTEETFSYDIRGRQDLQVTFDGVYIRTIYDDSAAGGGRVREKQFFSNTASYSNGSGAPSERLTSEYDAFGRIVEQKNIRPDSTDTYSTSYDAEGRVVQETAPAGFIRYEYDLLGRKTKLQAGVDAPAILSVIDYKYDALGKLATVSTVVRDGEIVDGNGLSEGTPPEATLYRYDLFGRLDYTAMPNGIVEDYTFDAMDRMDAVSLYKSDANNENLTDNTILSLIDYRYRQDGKRTGATEMLGGNGVGSLPVNPALTNAFSWFYDDAGRVTSEILDSSDDVLDQTETYIMDLVGNRLRRTVDKRGVTADTTDIYTYDSNDRLQYEERFRGVITEGLPHNPSLVQTTYKWQGTQQTSKTIYEGGVVGSAQAFSYGLSGQLERVITATHDETGNLSARTQVIYRYNTQGIRTISMEWQDLNLNGQFTADERSNAVEYLIENSNSSGYQQAILETVKDNAGRAIKRTSTTFGLDEITQTTTSIDPISSLTSTVSNITFGHDGRGSVRTLFDTSAVIAQLFTYSAYGELLGIHDRMGMPLSPESSLTSSLYNGEAYDFRIGMYNMRARWYTPSVARWDRLDPFAGNPINPFSYNKYTFVHGEPILGTDPTGMYLIAIDGTGTEDWLTNPRNPQKLSNGRWLSHVANFHDEYSPSSKKKYYDFGPRNGTFASDLTAIEYKALKDLDHFRSQSSTNSNEPIDIIGWSRGAYSAMRLATRLADRNIKVRFLGLYDPVDMTFFDNYSGLSSDPYRVPWNVEHTFVAVGVDGLSNCRDYDDDSPFWFNWPRIRVRQPYRSSEALTRSFKVSEYEATHGAIGGTPGYSPDPSIDRTYNYRHDVEQSIRVDTDMRTAARAAGVPVAQLAPSQYGFPSTRSSLPGQNVMPITNTWYNLAWRILSWAFQGAGV